MDYKELVVNISADYADILIAQLGELGFEAFSEDEELPGFKGYIIAQTADVPEIEACLDETRQITPLSYTWNNIGHTNWNQVWEDNFEPVTIAEQVYIRADFHEHSPEFPYEIMIIPKMSFGTGHHATTSLMISEMLELKKNGEFNTPAVLDAGCGTGILAIMAAKLDAGPIMAFDIDPWPVENSIENALNNATNLTVWQGTGIDLETRVANWDGPRRFNIVLANINRNILLSEMGYYVKVMAPNAVLIISGFYEDDIKILVQAGTSLGLAFRHSHLNGNWACINFVKLATNP